MFSNDLFDGLDLLANVGTTGLVAMLWYLIIFEIPRYGLSFLSLALLPFRAGQARLRSTRHEQIGQSLALQSKPVPVSVLVVGHSEAEALENCIDSLRAQSFSQFEIVVVSDGSRDAMVDVAERLLRGGKIDKLLSTDLRCGKSAGVNLAVRAATGDLLVNVDCDCSYDRFAIERILARFSDPTVGAVSGDIIPRNANSSLISALQTIEYLLSISLAKRAANTLEQVVCVSGAFGAFRRSALASIGGLDPGGAEDLDLTMRMRSRGWRIRFEPEAICYTDVPHTAWSLVRQRLRWERDSVRVRFRKHKRELSPFAKNFRSSETFHQVDFLLFHVLFAFVFPVYLAFMWLAFGHNAMFLLIAVQVVALMLDCLAFVIAIAITGRWHSFGMCAYLPAYSLYTSVFMRLVRLWAYIDEWAFDSSRKDSYVPERVAHSRQW
ncbi:MAG: glycosyltransferase family 2 protein [Hyphomicrobiaceae bacterium]